MPSKTLLSSNTNRLFVGASLKAGYLFAHAPDAGRAAFDPVPTPGKLTLVTPDPAQGPQDQWGIGSQLLGNTQLQAMIRVPVGASCVIAASSYAGISGYILDRKNGDLQQNGRMGKTKPVPLQPFRQKAGTSVESGAGIVGPYGINVPAIIEITAAPINRDVVIIGGGDLFVEVYTDSRPQQELSTPNLPVEVREVAVSDGTPPGPGSPFRIISVSPVVNASPWFCVTSYRLATDPIGMVRPYNNYMGRGTVNASGVPDLEFGDIEPSYFSHRLLSQMLVEAEAPYYSSKFAILGLAFLPDADFVYANAAFAPTTAVQAADIFIKDQPTYNPGPNTSYSPNYGIAALGAAN